MDSGSDVTILPLHLVKGCPLRPTDEKLNAANRSAIPVMGETTVSIATPKFSSTVTGVVTEHVSKAILGWDWMRDNRVKVDSGEGFIVVGGQRHDLSVRPYKGECRRVVLQQDMEVPTRSQIDLHCKVVLAGTVQSRFERRIRRSMGRAGVRVPHPSSPAFTSLERLRRTIVMSTCQ